LFIIFDFFLFANQLQTLLLYYVLQDFIMGMTIDFVATVNIRPGDQLAIKDVTSLFRSAWDA
jgi:hypothetical protein